MTCLDGSTKSLTIELSTSPTAQADWTVHYGRKNADGFAEVNVHGATNNTAEVTMVPSPAEGEVLSIRDITVFNNDNSAITFKIRLFEGATSRVIYAETLDSQEAWSSLAQKGRDGEAGATGTVNAASGLILDTSSAPNTVADQGAIYVNSNELFFRKANNAQPFKISAQREVLTADRTYYVRTDGNDSNDGLADTAGGAFLTWQAAIDKYASTVDHAGYSVTIQAGQSSTTFSLSSGLKLKKGIGKGLLILDLNGGTLQGSAGNLVSEGLIVADNVRDIIVKDATTMHASAWGTWAWHIQASFASQLILENHNFGATSNDSFGGHILAELNAIVYLSTSYNISGGGTGTYHILSRDDAIVQTPNQATVNITNTPPFLTFTEIQGAKVRSFQTNYSGSVATGCKKYNISGNGVLNVFGMGINIFPGSVAGTTATGGIVI